MTDKEKKNKIADILLEFYDEHYSNEINRPMIPSIYAGKILNSMQEEPVSEELEEAAQKYAESVNTIINKELHSVVTEIIAEAFQAGAKWQKKKMLKNAIEREVHEDAGGYPYIDATEFYDYDKDIPLAKEGDKIKVIMVKED